MHYKSIILAATLTLTLGGCQVYQKHNREARQAH